MKIKFKNLHPKAVLPSHAKDGDAGADLTAVRIEMVDDACTKELHRYGLSVEIPENHVGLLFPRSSVHDFCARLSNSVGVIDSGYRGEIKAIFDRPTRRGNEYQEGDRTAQLVIVPCISIRSEWAEELSETERGTGGYGHTGK